MRSRSLFILVVLVLCARCVFSQSESYTWHNVKMGGGGFVSGVITSKTEQNLVYARTDVGGAYRWDAGNQQWIPLLDWVSENEIGYLGVESIAIDPVSPSKVYMLAGTSYFNNGKTAILKSDDYGATFSVVDVTSQFKADGNGMGRQTGEKLAVDPNKPVILFCGSRSNGLFKSITSGATWTSVSGFPVPGATNGTNGVSFVVMDPSTGTAGQPTQTLIAGISTTGSNIYRSDNGGSSFSAIPGGPTNLMPHRAALSSDRNLFITYVNAAGPWDITSSGQIWKYNLQSGIWTNITPAAFPKPFGGISVDPSNPLRLVASTINTYLTQGTAYGDRIFLSTNGGTSWTDVVSRGFATDNNGISWINGYAIHWAGCVEFDPFDSKKAWIISGNGVWHTDDIDATTNVWKFAVKGLEETVPLDAVSVSNGPFVSAIGDYDGFRSDDVSEYAPIHQPSMGTTTGIAVAHRNQNIMVRVGDKMFYSEDMGATWTERTPKSKKGSVALSTDGKALLHCPEGSPKTYWSTDKGMTWTAATGLSVSEVKPVADPVNANKFYVYNPGTGSVMVSTNGGVSFVAGGVVGTGASKIVRPAPDREGELWVALYAGGLSRSSNSGTAFTKVSTVSSCGAVGFGKPAVGKTFPTVFIWGVVGGVTGAFRSIDEGTSWSRVNDDDHEFGGPGNGQFITGDPNVFGRVYMSTAGRGVVYGESTQGCIPSRVIPHSQVNSNTAHSSPVVDVEVDQNVTLSPEPLSGGSWSWAGPGGFASTDREIHINAIQAPSMGIYSVLYTDDAGCMSAAEVFTVASPVIKATSIKVKGANDSHTIDSMGGTLQLSTEFQPSDVSNDAVMWSVSNAARATVSASGLLTAISNGDVTVRATATDGSDAFGELVVNISNQAVGWNATGSEMSIFPNPCGKYLNVRSSETMKIEIFDVRGLLVLSQSNAFGMAESELKLDLKPGTYLVRLTGREKVTVKRIVVE